MNRRTYLAGLIAAASNVGIRRAFSQEKYRVAIIGCGRMGQLFAEVYRAMPDAELVAIAEWNPERRRVVGERFGVKALYQDVNALLKDMVPDIAAVITPTKFMKDAVIACAEAGVKGVSTDKPMAARLSDADQMVDACARHNVVFAGGNLQRAKPEVQEAARRLWAGEYGQPSGVAMHGFGGEIVGGGCQYLSVLRLLTRAEVDEVIAWASPTAALAQPSDEGLNINARFHLTSGMECQVFGPTAALPQGETPLIGVDVWTGDSLVRWNWGAPEIFRGTDSKGARMRIDPKYAPFPWRDIVTKAGLTPAEDYLVGSIRSFLDAVRTGSELWISGRDLRQALEIAIACKLSAQLGNRPVKLPLEDRSLALFPSAYRWLGGDATKQPQTPEEASGKKS
jgi:predicted dehydrogenase